MFDIRGLVLDIRTVLMSGAPSMSAEIFTVSPERYDCVSNSDMVSSLILHLRDAPAVHCTDTQLVEKDKNLHHN